jgi:two-component system response regulator BaeR
MRDQTILVVEDEPKIAKLLTDYLDEAGYHTRVCADGSQAVSLISELKPNCILLDVMLPGKDGLTICKEVRQFSMVPIVIITARVDEIDRLLGLELGADDYICKPFSPREVVVRVRNILRRVAIVDASKNLDNNQADYSSPLPTEQINYRDLHLDFEKFICQLNGEVISLTAVEFRMLFAMTKRPGSIFTRNQLMSVAYNDGRIVSDRTIDSHIKNMRRKLTSVEQSDKSMEELIHSIYGVGYKVE